MTQTQLFKFTCSSTKSGIYLSAYASTIVYSLLPSDQGAHTRGNLIAIHFGGEPSTVQALCTLIASGMPLQLTTPEGNVEFTPRKAQYQKTITGSNGYAEAILSLGQEEKKEREEKKNVQGESYFVTRIKERRFYFYTPAGDDTRLFQLLDQHSHMPLLLGFQEYILTEARRCGALTPLTVLSSTETFDAWQLKLNENEQNLRAILETGLHERKITIPGADPHASDAFEKVGTISQYFDQVQESFQLYRRCVNRRQMDTVLGKMLDDMEAVKVQSRGGMYFVPRQHMAKIDIFEDFLETMNEHALSENQVDVNSMYVVDNERQREKMAHEFYVALKKEIETYQERASHLINTGCESPTIMARWVSKIRELGEKRRRYEALFQRQISEVDGEFNTLQGFARELQVRIDHAHLKPLRSCA